MDDLPKLLALLLTLVAILPHVSGEIPRREVESATAALRFRGYNLFGNSLTVSDLLFQVLTGDEFTFLSPPDTSLFSLGMSIDSFRYVHSLRLHVIPRRLSISDLRNLSLSRSPSTETLVPSHSLFLANRRRDFTSGADANSNSSGVFDYVVVNGIRISSPNIYLGPNIAVHGLEGTLAADMLPPDTFQGDLGLSFASPPAWPPSEIPAPFPSTGPYPDPIPPTMSPMIDVFSPDFKGTPIFTYPDFPPPVPRVPSPVSDTFANSPQSAASYPDLPPLTPRVPSPVIDAFANPPQPANLVPVPSYPVLPPPTPRVPSPVSDEFANLPQTANLAPGTVAPVAPPPSVSTPLPKIAEIPNPWNDGSSSGETGHVESSFRPNPTPESSPSVDLLLPRQAPPNPPPQDLPPRQASPNPPPQDLPPQAPPNPPPQDLPPRQASPNPPPQDLLLPRQAPPNPPPQDLPPRQASPNPPPQDLLPPRQASPNPPPQDLPPRQASPNPPPQDLPPHQAPLIPPPRIWGTAPPPYQKVWRNFPNQPWRNPKESSESAEHKKSNKKRKSKKNRHHHRKHKGQ